MMTLSSLGEQWFNSECRYNYTFLYSLIVFVVQGHAVNGFSIIPYVWPPSTAAQSKF